MHGALTQFVAVTLSIRWYAIAHWFGKMVCYSVPNIRLFTLEKMLLFENGINQILIKQMKLYSVMWFFVKTCMLSPNFKVTLTFYGV